MKKIIGCILILPLASLIVVGCGASFVEMYQADPAHVKATIIVVIMLILATIGIYLLDE